VKKRVVIELSIDDYKALSFVKSILGLEWKDLLVAGAVYWSNEYNLEEKINAIRKLMSKEEKFEKGGDEHVKDRGN